MDLKIDSGFNPVYISNNDFHTAYYVLDKLTTEPKHEIHSATPVKKKPLVSSKVALESLKILNKAVREGSPFHKQALAHFRHQIVALNELFNSPDFEKKVSERLGLTEEQARMIRRQVAVPQTRFEHLVEVATRIPRAAIALLGDLALFHVSFIMILVALGIKRERHPFDVDQVKKAKSEGKPHIFLLHGSGFNDTQWILGKFVLNTLKKGKYGSTSSMNFDGLASNDPNKGIDDYAKALREEILKIKKATGQTHFILIGHSMGGWIATYYAEMFANKDGVAVEHVMGIGTPFRGSPALEKMGHIPDTIEKGEPPGKANSKTKTKRKTARHHPPSKADKKKVILKPIKSDHKLKHSAKVKKLAPAIMGGILHGYYDDAFADPEGVLHPKKDAAVLASYKKTPKRYQQMSIGSKFGSKLVEKAVRSERSGKRKYYHSAATTDPAAPAPYSVISEDPQRQQILTHLGHYGLVVAPSVWIQICQWLEAKG